MYDLFLATLHPSSFGGAKLLGPSVLCYGFVVHRYSVCGAHYIYSAALWCVCMLVRSFIFQARTMARAMDKRSSFAHGVVFLSADELPLPLRCAKM
jgi:hypothetical protein